HRREVGKARHAPSLRYHVVLGQRPRSVVEVLQIFNTAHDSSQKLDQPILRVEVMHLLRNRYLPQPLQQSVLLPELPESDKHAMFGVGDRPVWRRYLNGRFLRPQAYRQPAWPRKIASDST